MLYRLSHCKTESCNKKLGLKKTKRDTRNSATVTLKFDQGTAKGESPIFITELRPLAKAAVYLARKTGLNVLQSLRRVNKRILLVHTAEPKKAPRRHSCAPSGSL